MNPKLRPVEVRLFVDQGRPVFILRDPLALSDKIAIVPQVLGPLLALLDGSRDVAGVHAALLVRAGMRVAPEIIQRVIDQLDDALLLQNDHFAQAYAETLRAYRTAPFRPPALAGPSYPAEPAALRSLLDGYLGRISVNGSNANSSIGHLASLTHVTPDSLPVSPGDSDGSEHSQSRTGIVGLVSPHIDYQRGGRVYAGAWGRAAAAVRNADLAIILGTDHAGGAGRITLTRQHYATPYGVLPTASDVVDAIAAAIGEEAAFAEEIHHRGEHSVELAAVWLHHMRDGQPCQVLPILCGSFHHFIQGQADPATDATLNTTLDVLRAAAAGRRVVVIAAADLAHVGPAFSDPFPIDHIQYARLQAADEILIQTITDGDADAFFRTIAAEGDRRNICGLPPIYLTLRLLNGQGRGELTGYERCPADGQNTSFVSVCGVVFRKSGDKSQQISESANQRISESANQQISKPANE
jgi:AmmeMemoRadiSam system protein B